MHNILHYPRKYCVMFSNIQLFKFNGSKHTILFILDASEMVEWLKHRNNINVSPSAPSYKFNPNLCVWAIVGFLVVDQLRCVQNNGIMAPWWIHEENFCSLGTVTGNSMSNSIKKKTFWISVWAMFRRGTKYLTCPLQLKMAKRLEFELLEFSNIKSFSIFLFYLRS